MKKMVGTKKSSGSRHDSGLPALLSASAWAASPPFAYTEEEWAAIRDNKLEFEEIDKRIHEYNTTVRQNEISYKDYQGKDSSEIAQEYYDAAEEIYDSSRIWIQILLPMRRLWLPISIMSRERKA